MLQGRGVAINCEGDRNVKCSNNNKYYSIYACIIDKNIIISYF